MSKSDNDTLTASAYEKVLDANKGDRAKTNAWFNDQHREMGTSPLNMIARGRAHTVNEFIDKNFRGKK